MNEETKSLPLARRKAKLLGRAYQLELFELAKASNVREPRVRNVLVTLSQVVVYLDTGSGKTFVSVLLIRHVYAKVAERPEPHAPFLAVFMAPTVALVEQQFGVLKSQLDLRVARCIATVTPTVYRSTRTTTQVCRSAQHRLVGRHSLAV